MPVYEYKALNEKGKQISGLLDAGHMNAAKNELRNSRLFLVSMIEADAPSVEGQKKKLLFYPGITVSETAAMTRQLATLIAAGFPLIRALNAMLVQVKKQSLKRIISTIKDSIEEGSSFAGALGRYPGIFSSLYINMVRAGEASGTLGIVLERLAEFLEKQSKMKRKLQAVLAYPCIMTLICIGVLFFLITVIVPNITAIFDDMNQALPFTTQILIDVSRALRQWWWLVFAAVALLILSYTLLIKRPSFRMARDRFILNLPGVGEMVRKIAVARFARTLGSLLQNGVSILDALEIVQKVVGNKVIEESLRQAGVEVERGRELGDVLSHLSCFPHFSVQMIQVGEQTGKLESMLKKTARVYDEEVETAIMGITSLVEPVIILVMAMVVGFIVLSICLPIFEMNQLIK